MTHGRQSQPATAITRDAGRSADPCRRRLLAAVDIPPFKPIMAVCGSDQFQEVGRRAACESTMATARCLGFHHCAEPECERATSSGGPREVPRPQRYTGRSLQQQYLVQASGRVRGAQANADADLRVAAMRQAATEEAADKVVLTAFREPVERPADWHGPDSN